MIPLCEEFSLLPPMGVMKNLSGTFCNSSSITFPSSFVIQFAARGTPSLAARRILFPATCQYEISCIEVIKLKSYLTIYTRVLYTSKHTHLSSSCVKQEICFYFSPRSSPWHGMSPKTWFSSKCWTHESTSRCTKTLEHQWKIIDLINNFSIIILTHLTILKYPILPDQYNLL